VHSVSDLLFIATKQKTVDKLEGEIAVAENRNTTRWSSCR
jgi:hypothetical protein